LDGAEERHCPCPCPTCLSCPAILMPTQREAAHVIFQCSILSSEDGFSRVVAF
jgi:hypothetical protein